MSDMESLNKQEINFLKEQIKDLKTRMDEGFDKLNAKLEILIEGYVKRDEMEKAVAALEKEIDGLQSNWTWLVRTIIGTIVVAAIGAVIAFK